MKAFTKYGSLVVIIYVFIFLSLYFSMMAYREQFSTVQGASPSLTPVVPAPVRDPALALLLQELAVDDTFASLISISYVESYENQPEVNGQHQTEKYPDGTRRSAITIKRGTEMQPVHVAHEYLHAIWENKLTDVEKVPLGSELKVMYAADPGFQMRAKHYIDNHKLTDSELFSIYCTESSDTYLAENILNECNKHINRSSITFAR